MMINVQRTIPIAKSNLQLQSYNQIYVIIMMHICLIKVLLKPVLVKGNILFTALAAGGDNSNKEVISKILLSLLIV